MNRHKNYLWNCFLFLSVNSSTILAEYTSYNVFNLCVGNVDWIGDGICDSDLLTRQCSYDGGDCCDGIIKDYCIDSGTWCCVMLPLGAARRL